ncbi:hypothetical protein Gohar_003788, partial [Gossypium harknessii]|nr:hypothetical protein [Gossypium harknessii]
MKRNYLKISSVSTIKRNDEPKEVKPIEKKTSMFNSMVLIPKKKNGGEELMFLDINIAGQKKSALVDTGASDLFISKKAAGKLGLLIKKLNRKIKTGKEEFEVIQLDDYDYVLGLNVLDRIQAALYPWADQIHIITSPVSGVRDRYEAYRFDCGADTFGKGGLCIGLRGKKNDTEPVGRSLSKFISNETEGLWAIRSQEAEAKVSKEVTTRLQDKLRGNQGNERVPSPQELARFKELLEKPVRLKPGWSDNENM